MKSMDQEIEIGVIHGRFQVLHNDHLKYLLAGKRLCHHLVIGITNPDPFLTKDDNTDTKRSATISNPLTYYERYIMVRLALIEAGVNHAHFSVVPLPINLPELYHYYVPMNAVFFLTIYDEWGKKKLSYFKSLGLKTHILWEVPQENKGICGSDIRKKMLSDEPWEHMLPPAVAALMKRWKIPERLKKINNDSQM